MIDKALIPIAGLATRLRPLSRVVPKALFPLVDRSGRLRCVLHAICAEVKAAGIEQVGLIVGPGQESICQGYLDAARQGGARDLPRLIETIVQPKPAGFGDAVARGAKFIGPQQRFLLLLGDHVQLPEPGQPPCAAQVAEAFDRHGGAAMIGVQPVGADELGRVGVARGQPAGEGVYRCTGFVEKPDPNEASQELITPGLPEGRFLAHCGIYGFTDEIFDCLSELTRAHRPEGVEIQLADAQSLLLRRHPEDYYLVRIAGRAWDTGTPSGYAGAFQAAADSL